MEFTKNKYTHTLLLHKYTYNILFLLLQCFPFAKKIEDMLIINRPGVAGAVL